MKNAKQTDIDFVGKRKVYYKQELFLSIHFRSNEQINPNLKQITVYILLLEI